MDIELNVQDRLGLLSLLPREGNLTTLRIVQQLLIELSFSEEEHASLKFQSNDGELRWNEEADQPRTIAFGAKAMQIVQSLLGDLNEGGKLRMEHLGLCEKFSIGED